MALLLSKIIAFFNLLSSAWLLYLLNRTVLPGLKRFRIAIALYFAFNLNILLIIFFPWLPVLYLTVGWIALAIVGGFSHVFRPFFKKEYSYFIFVLTTWLVIFGLFWVHLYKGFFQVSIQASNQSIHIILTKPGRIFLFMAFGPLMLSLIYWKHWAKQIDYYFQKTAAYLKILIAITLSINLGTLIHLFLSSKLNPYFSVLSYLFNGITIATLAFLLSKKSIFQPTVISALPKKQSSGASVLIYLGIYFVVIGFFYKLQLIYGGIWKPIFLIALISGAVFLPLLLVAGKEIRRLWIQFIQKVFILPKYDFRHEITYLTNSIRDARDERSCMQSILQVVSETLGVEKVGFCVQQSNFDNEYKPYFYDNGNLIEGSVFRLRPRENEIRVTKKENILSREGFNKLFPRPPKHIFNSFDYFLPIWIGEEQIGILMLGQRNDGDDFDYEDLQLLQLFANAIGIALHRFQLYENLMLLKQREAINQIAGYVLHELRNNTSILSLLVQNAQKNFDNPDFQKEFLNGVSVVSDEMQALIRKIGTYRDGKIEIHRSIINLNDLLETVFREIPIPDKIRLRTQIKDTIRASLDKDLIKIAFRNVLMNCIESMTDGGEIFIQAEINPKENYLQIIFRDQGHGMTDSFIEQYLFKPYESTKPFGLGLGMHQTREIVQGHDGEITVKSKPGKGTAIIIRLPLIVPNKPNTSHRWLGDEAQIECNS